MFVIHFILFTVYDLKWRGRKKHNRTNTPNSQSSGKILSFALNMVDLDRSFDGYVQGKNTFLFLAEVPSPKAEGGVEMRGAYRHLGRPRANNLS